MMLASAIARDDGGGVPRYRIFWLMFGKFN